MQSAATVLDAIHKRSERGLPLQRLYRQLFNPQLYLLAYGRIYANKGAMTPGVTPETVDGMSLAKIGSIIDALRAECYRWRPVKRVHIPKKNGKLRPLGLPTWSDKLVAEVVRLLLEAYYEPQFSDRSRRYSSTSAKPSSASRACRRCSTTRCSAVGPLAAVAAARCRLVGVTRRTR
jgi:retron-type reverse transcriptase